MTGQPEQRFSCGLVKATVWKNKSKAGEEYRTVSISKSYQKDGEWHNTGSFGASDINKLLNVLEQARDFLDPAS